MGGQSSARAPLGSSTAFLQIPSWWGLLPLPKNPTPLLASIFGPSGLIGQHLPKVISQCVRVLIKILVVPIFGAKECIRMQEFVLKIYQKFRGSRPPDPHAGRGDICLHLPHAHPPNAGAPLLLLGWLRPCLEEDGNLDRMEKVVCDAHLSILNELPFAFWQI